MSAIAIAFVGAGGRMGRALLPALAEESEVQVVATFDRQEDLAESLRRSGAEVAVDFTSPSSAAANVRAILAAGLHGVVGTTGFSSSDLDALDREARAAGRGVVIAPNFSLGMVLLQRAATLLAPHFSRVEIVETHQEGKKDAPSGTALDTARRLVSAGAIEGEEGEAQSPARGLAEAGVRIHSLRLPGAFARQEIHLAGPDEGLVLVHEARSRRCYLPGLLLALRAVRGRIGLTRGLEELLG